MSVKERMKMFNKKSAQPFKVETQASVRKASRGERRKGGAVGAPLA